MLKGKTAVVTGGSRGIGKAIAMAMAKHGADIAIIFYDNRLAAEAVCKEAAQFGVKAEGYQCNVADFEGSKKICDKIISDFGKVDILVNNAGITKDSLILRMSDKDFASVIDVSLKGSFNFIKHLSKSIMRSGSGRIINISSVIGIMGNSGQANYSTAKAGLIGLTKTVAKEFSSRNVTCNAIAPGFIETEMTADLPQTVKDNLLTSIPLKRIGKPQEVANLAVFLASDLSSYITGEVIKVDGGMCI